MKFSITKRAGTSTRLLRISGVPRLPGSGWPVGRRRVISPLWIYAVRVGACHSGVAPRASEIMRMGTMVRLLLMKGATSLVMGVPLW